MLSAVLRQELAGDGIAVSLLSPSITATEFGDGMFTLGTSPRPGSLHPEPARTAPRFPRPGMRGAARINISLIYPFDTSGR